MHMWYVFSRDWEAIDKKNNAININVLIFNFHIPLKSKSLKF